MNFLQRALVKELLDFFGFLSNVFEVVVDRADRDLSVLILKIDSQIRQPAESGIAVIVPDK